MKEREEEEEEEEWKGEKQRSGGGDDALFLSFFSQKCNLQQVRQEGATLLIFP